MNGPNLYRVLGGTAVCRQLSVAFYARVQKDAVLRPLFPGKTLKCAIEEFAAFLAQLFGGPVEDAQRRWWLSLRESHLRFKIGPKERDAWMKNMIQALRDVPLEEEGRVALRDFFERSSAYVVNVGEAPECRPALPPAKCIRKCPADGALNALWMRQWLHSPAAQHIMPSVWRKARSCKRISTGIAPSSRLCWQR